MSCASAALGKNSEDDQEQQCTAFLKSIHGVKEELLQRLLELHFAQVYLKM